jgi:hypothetical protein
MAVQLPWLLGALLAAIALPANAALITLDFNNLTPGYFAEDLNLQGFRLSPNCHYDAIPSGGYSGSAWLGFDTSGCSGSLFNPDYVGPPPTLPNTARLYVDLYGAEFSLVSVYDVIPFYEIYSSKGGHVALGTSRDRGCRTLACEGDEWTGIQWLLFDSPGSPGQADGFDHLVLDIPVKVPEPGTLLLLTASLGLVPLLRTRRLRHRTFRYR